MAVGGIARYLVYLIYKYILYAYICRAIFDRLFKWLIVKCNNTLIDPTLKVSLFR